MSGYTIQQIIGSNSTQDVGAIIVSKEDLTQTIGFQSLPENDGEAIFVALMLQALVLGLDTDSRDGTNEQDSNFNQQVAINRPSRALITRVDANGNLRYFKRDSYTIDLDLPLSQVDPSD